MSYHNYADDTQIYVSLMAGEHGPVDTLCHCIEQLSVWLQNNFIQLNSDKTKIIVFGPQKQRESVISHLETLSLKPNNQFRNLGVILDSDLNFNSHIKSITSAAFYHLKNIARIKGIVSKPDLERLIHAFVSSRLDYWNEDGAVVCGWPSTSATFSVYCPVFNRFYLMEWHLYWCMIA